MSVRLLIGYIIQGQTPGAVPIASVTVNYNSDGTWDFQDTAAVPDTLIYHGNDAAINKLLSMIFAGSSGLGTNSLIGYVG